MDPLLKPFLTAVSDSETEKALSELFNQGIEPVLLKKRKNLVADALARNPGGSKSTDLAEIEDALSEARLRLISRLFQVKGDPSTNEIDSIASYSYTTATSAYNGLLRERNPLRAKLSDRIRYVLTDNKRRTGFALWTSNDDESVAGYASCAGKDAGTGRLFQELFADPGSVKESALANAPAQPGIADLVHAALTWAGGPIRFQSLVSILANWTDTFDELVSLQETGPDDDNLIFDPADPAPGPAEQSDTGTGLKLLWVALLELALPWRASFLLHSDLTHDFVTRLITNRKGMAEALGISADELERIWNEIPMQDLLIANRMKLTRQQVINLRRLTRDALFKKLSPILNFPQKFR